MARGFGPPFGKEFYSMRGDIVREQWVGSGGSGLLWREGRMEGGDKLFISLF